MFSSGKITELPAFNKNRGWIIGSFVRNKFFHSENFEIKWGVHPKGFQKEGLHTRQAINTVAILVSGKIRFTFPQITKKISLEQTGDYVTYDTASTDHYYEVMEDCIIMTIRWPAGVKN